MVSCSFSSTPKTKNTLEPVSIIDLPSSNEIKQARLGKKLAPSKKFNPRGHKFRTSEHKPSGKLKNEPKSTKRRRTKRHCRKVVKNTLIPLMSLKKSLRISVDSETPRKKTKIAGLLNLNLSDCGSKRKSKRTFKRIAKAINQHSGKIGLILPLSGPKSFMANSIITGIQAAALGSGKKFEDHYVVKDSKGTMGGTKAALAELIFEENISMVVSGLDQIEAQTIIPYTKRLMIPTMIINSNSQLVKSSNYAFQVFPLQKHQASRMVQAIKNRGLRKVAIFEPSSGKASRLIKHLEVLLEKEEITLTHKIRYHAGNFDSMESAVKEIAGINYVTRRDEFDTAYRKAKQKAKDANVGFNPRTIILNPIMQTGAVIIPDDFRIIRHFVNVFKYHRVYRFLMVGNHEWRSRALIEPWENFLHGSFFVDFIGSYHHLPKGIARQNLDSPYFAPPAKIAELDFQLIGYRTGSIALRTLKDEQIRRRDYARVLTDLKSQGGFFTESEVFDSNRSSYWPTYMFAINNQSLLLLNSPKSSVGFTWPSDFIKEKKLTPGAISFAEAKDFEEAVARSPVIRKKINSGKLIPRRRTSRKSATLKKLAPQKRPKSGWD